MARLHANKAELLMVLDRPEIPLHTNGSENDIRCYVTRRKVSAGTRSDVGRDCRDAFLGLAKTCEKLGIARWDYLASRLKVAGHMVVQPLDHYVRSSNPPRLTAGGANTLTPLTLLLDGDDASEIGQSALLLGVEVRPSFQRRPQPILRQR
jgi:hypothetical protein